MTAGQLLFPAVQLAVQPLGFEAEKELGLEPFNPRCFFPYWAAAVNDDRGVVFLSTHGFDVTGILCAYVYEDDFSGHRFGLEGHWFVTKEHRGTLAGGRLLHEFEREARDRKCHSIFVAKQVRGFEPSRSGLFRKRL